MFACDYESCVGIFLAKTNALIFCIYIYFVSGSICPIPKFLCSSVKLFRWKLSMMACVIGFQYKTNLGTIRMYAHDRLLFSKHCKYEINVNSASGVSCEILQSTVGITKMMFS